MADMLHGFSTDEVMTSDKLRDKTRLKVGYKMGASMNNINALRV